MLANGERGEETADEGGVHVSIPLLVDHARGFSATWNEIVIRPYEGSAVFW